MSLVRSAPGLRFTGVSLALFLAACSSKSNDSGTAVPPASSAPSMTMAMAPMTRQKAPEGAKVYFSNLKDGDSVTSPFKIVFGSDKLTIAPAGTLDTGTGHYHLIIDSELPPQSLPLPQSESVKHYGKGQTETELSLPAGKHTLQIEAADGAHVPFDPPLVSEVITLTVN